MKNPHPTVSKKNNNQNLTGSWFECPYLATDFFLDS